MTCPLSACSGGGCSAAAAPAAQSSCPGGSCGAQAGEAGGGASDVMKMIKDLLTQLLGGEGGSGPAKSGKPTGNDFSKTLFGDQSQEWASGPQRTMAGFHQMTMDLMGQQAGRSGGFF